ncbi:MAG: nicotinate phosphoribosyltransferase [Geobacter sp.]|nr:MAG: nicotinate phosphoribosyltransferase [Geobacter sp.]
MSYSALLTDLYQLTMLAGYFEKGMNDDPAVFDLFFRTPPFKGGYVVFAGLETALRYLSELRFTDGDLSYLKTLGIFKDSFLDYLENFRFQGRVIAMQEGTVAFSLEPLVSVEAPLAQAQFVETALLNIINFQSLVATKAARIVSVADGKEIVEFGLRRAQGPDGGLSEVRGAYIGGARSSSNVRAGQTLGIPVKGTHAHSWIMAFPDELSSFRAYADVFPDSSTLLVDTYDTLKSGIPNAIIVARELREKGHELRAVRLDSGDLAFLSRESRRMLDAAGFPDVKILASNELDEYVIRSIREQGGQVDIYGVGTRLATCQGEGGGALGGVYKLVRYNGKPKLKVTSDISKSTIPGRKKLLRASDGDGTFLMDIICRENETPAPRDLLYNPRDPQKTIRIPESAVLEPIRSIVMAEGVVTEPSPSLCEIADRCQAQLGCLADGVLRFEDVLPYGVYLSRGLHELRMRLIDEVQKGYQ